MIITLIDQTGINSITLPERVNGQYWLERIVDGVKEKSICIEGINGNWTLKSNRNYKIVNEQSQPQKTAIVEELNRYIILDKNGQPIFAYAEPVTEDRQHFSKFLLKDDVELTIGRSDSSKLCFRNRFVSSQHATISFSSGKWYISDNNSSNGTYVNGEKITFGELKLGDSVYIMGLKLVVGKNLIAFNNPDGMLNINSDALIPFVQQSIEAYDEEDDELELTDEGVFYRSPRFKRDIETLELKVDSPTQSPITDETPMALALGSSAAMGLMSIATLANAFTTGNTMSMVMGGSMLMGTLLIPIITKVYEKNNKKKQEALRQLKYREYLDTISVKLNEESELQSEILNENFVTIDDCLNRIKNISRNLWERGPGQNDFLALRLGTGTGKLDVELNYQERSFSVDSDNLQDEMYLLCNKPKEIENIPITLSLFEDYISAVIGDKDKLFDFANGIIFQLAALYSYDEVKFVFLYDEADRAQFDYVKWLPHVWSDDKKFRFIACNANELKEISAYLEKEIEYRSEINENEIPDTSPYYIIFSMSKQLATRAEMIKQILSKKKNLNFSIVTFYENLKDVPRESSKIVELRESGKVFDRNDISGTYVEFMPDIELHDNLRKLSVKLANVQLNTLANAYQLPQMITFLQMYGVGKVEHLNALTRWKENDPTKTLEAAVGVDTMGELFNLDIHEKFHGPHGLIAGMTGSGKSEFIMTYILSLAINYHPNELAFILIDYKGGGMAKSFEHLPHTAGIITNLDGAAIKRSLVSIQSELKRRQSIFSQVSKDIGVSNIDIYKYQKLFREGKVSEPLQHLLIISDEFAELKTQEPEFMTQLVSAARIGRSLGVHLILATQKPSGVVDDQIWSNSRFKVCLKVQERADSMDMIKRQDAAELVETGRFFLQVGYNELFELGQSAWSGAPYYPSDKVQIEKDNGITVIDINGHHIKECKLDTRKTLFANPGKQLDEITDYLKKIAEDEGIKVKPLWLEPIPAVILLEDLVKKYSTKSEKFALNPVIGEYDDPVRQKQSVLRLPLSAEGNAIVYGVSGSGKSMFAETMLYSLIHEHTAEELNLYLLDFDTETLKAFSQAPQVGDVILSYEAEKITNLFKMLVKEADHRKKLFADYGGNYASYIKTSGNTLPNIVVTICNFAAFMELYEDLGDLISYLTREGTKFGIFFVLTAANTGDVRYRLQQNFKQLIVLQLNDDNDYSVIVGKTDGLYPANYKGRGLVKMTEVYEFQTASLVEDNISFTYINDECIALKDAWSGKRAKSVPMLPEVVNKDFLLDSIDKKNIQAIPIGIEQNTLNVHRYNFFDQRINIILSEGDEYSTVLSSVINLIGAEYSQPGIVFDLPGDMLNDNGSLTIVKRSEDCSSAIGELFDTLVYRNNTYKSAKESGNKCEKFSPLFIVINSISTLRSVLSEEDNEKLALILEKSMLEFNTTIIIGEQVKAISSVSYEKWYRDNVNANYGIWVGNGIAEQYVLKVNSNSRELNEEIKPDFGYVLLKGKTIRVKLINSSEV